MHAIRIRGMLVAALAAAALALCALAMPAAATATEAAGIVSGGLVYDDVYGVVADHALMAKDDGTIDVVNSSGKVTFSTTSSESRTDVLQRSFGHGDGCFIVRNDTADKLYKNDGTLLLEADDYCIRLNEETYPANYAAVGSGNSVSLYSLSECKTIDTKSTGVSNITYVGFSSDAAGSLGLYLGGYNGSTFRYEKYAVSDGKIGELTFFSESETSSSSLTGSESSATLQWGGAGEIGSLPDGTVLYTDRAGGIEDENGNAITLGGYTLAQPRLTADLLEHYYNYYNKDSANSAESVQRGASDAYYAVDSSGNYGAVSSTGEVVIPFEFECIEDLGIADESLILVKKGGLWYFYDTAEKATTQDMYRLYNPNSGEHFYTASTVEKNNLVSVGWNYEGIGWTAPVKSNTPVYRLYNPNVDPTTGSGEHHYTTDVNERNTLVAAGWTNEGTGWYSDDAKGVPLYRQYNPNQFNCNHNYTTSTYERDYLVSLGWNDEGIGWYGVK